MRWGILMPMFYAQVFANNLNNGFIDIAAQTKGELSWTAGIFQSKEEPEEIGSLLSSEKQVFVIGATKIYAFDTKGGFLWKRNRYPFTPVVIRKDLMYLISPNRSGYMQTIHLNNTSAAEDFDIPLAGQKAYLVLFEPIEKGIIAQVQDVPDPDDGSTGFAIFKEVEGGLGFEWDKSYNNQKSRVIPIVISSRNVLVTSTKKEAIILRLDAKQHEPAPVAQFPLPLGESTLWLSGSETGQLYWSGFDRSEPRVVCTDLKGKELWNWKSGSTEIKTFATPLFPPIIAHDKVFVLTSKKVFCINKGKTEWEYDAGIGSMTTATAVKNNVLLVTMGNLLIMLSETGKVIFKIELEEVLKTAPALDGAGQIYVAGAHTLFAIE
jgi:outer membrane protein assembly factor BamB